MSSPLSADHEGKESLSASSNLPLSFRCLLALISLRIPWDYVDYVDYVDDSDDTPADSFMTERHFNKTVAAQEKEHSITGCRDAALLKQELHQQETAVISVINRHQSHQVQASISLMGNQGQLPCEADVIPGAEQNDVSVQRKRCPHHPHARMVRFDPAGQARCDRMDCWDCYRLMKIGEALGYCYVIDR